MNRLPGLVIFDMDGLMFDTERLFMNYIIDSANEYGYDFTKELYKKTIGTGGENLKRIICSELGEDYPLKEISKLAQEKLSVYIKDNKLPIKKGLVSLLDFLEDNNIKKCIASSTNKEHILKYLSNTKLDKYFDIIISGDMVKNAKPAPDIFLLASSKCGVLCEECLVLEDSINGVLAASEAKIPVICIPDLVEPTKEVKKKSFRVFETLTDVENLLADIKENR